MNIRCIGLITKWLLPLGLFFALLPRAAVAGETATLDQQLLEAAARGNPELVRTLLDKGADVNAKTSSGYTPLVWAALGENVAVVEFLIDRGADINDKDNGLIR